MVVVPHLFNIRFKQDFPLDVSDGALSLEIPGKGTPSLALNYVPITRYNLPLMHANWRHTTDPRPDDYQFWRKGFGLDSRIRESLWIQRQNLQADYNEHKRFISLGKVSALFIRYDIPEPLRGKSGLELQKCLPPHLTTVPKIARELLSHHIGLLPHKISQASEKGWYKDLICLNPDYQPPFVMSFEWADEWVADFFGHNHLDFNWDLQ